MQCWRVFSLEIDLGLADSGTGFVLRRYCKSFDIVEVWIRGMKRLGAVWSCATDDPIHQKRFSAAVNTWYARGPSLKNFAGGFREETPSIHDSQFLPSLALAMVSTFLALDLQD
jgi:hypothetical protein